MRLCNECAADISDRHWKARFCVSCAKVRKHRKWHEQRSAAYMVRSCGWCGGSLANRSQQARFCSTGCLERRRYADNKAARLAGVKAYAASDAGKAMYRERRRRRRARRAELLVVPFTQEQLAARMSMFSGCWICGSAWDTVDHVKPQCSGGAHILANLRPACRSCNSRKNGHWSGVRDALARAVVSR